LRFHPPLEKEVLLEDLDRIRDLYIDKGFFDVKVYKPKIELKGDEYYITIIIKEGRRYKLTGLDIKGNDLFTRKELFEDIKYKPKINDYYDGKAIKALKENILKKYTDLGFVFTKVYVKKIINRKNATVKVKYIINKNKRFFIDMINISGNYESKDSTIRRELTFSPGDLFVRDKIKKSQSRIYRLGFYNGIAFDPVFKGADLMDIDVKVSERFTGQMSLGVGYSQFTGFSVFGSLKKGNFRGTGDTISASISIGTRYKNNQIGYIHKWAFYKPVDVGFSLYQRSADYYSFTSERTGFYTTFSYRFNDIWSTGLTVGYDRVTYKDIEDYAPTRIKEQEGTYSLPSIAWYINRYTVDNRLLPTEGMDTTLTLKTGFGSRGFYKYVISHTMFFKDKIFYTDWVFSFKVRYGEIIQNGDKIPLDELFFVGGDFTIRGFDYGMAGPYDQNLDPLGAKKEIILNYQLSHPITEKLLWGYVFLDQGKGFDSGDPFSDMYYSVGAGIKIVTPIAPIDIYYGKVQNPPPGVGSSRLGFIIGTFF
jgi:outer membrane protein insertion porin family